MSGKSPVLNSNEAKARIRASGITVTQWAEQRGYRRETVYRVLNGQLKANFGQAHEIAVQLGMKKPSDEFTSHSTSGNPQTKVA